MPRKRQELWPVIAVTTTRLSEALDIEHREIVDAIRKDLLPAFQHGTKRRILVSDAEAWIRNTWPRVRIKAKLKSHKESRHADAS